MVTGVLLFVSSHDGYALIIPGSTLLYVTQFVAGKFRVEPEQSGKPFSVSTPIGESVVAGRVLWGL